MSQSNPAWPYKISLAHVLYFTKSKIATRELGRPSLMTAPFWHWVYYLKRCMSIKCHVQALTSRLIFTIFKFLYFKENSGIRILKVILFGFNQKKSRKGVPESLSSMIEKFALNIASGPEVLGIINFGEANLERNLFEFWTIPKIKISICQGNDRKF